MAFTLTSPAFKNDSRIPKKYSGEGENVSPPLEWDGIPKGTVELALLCDDPDAPRPEPFVHWIVYGLSPKVTSLPEGVPIKERLERPVAATQGMSSFPKPGYGGPLPPVGHGVHHYIFKLYALGGETGLPPGASKEELLEAVKDKTIAVAELVGTYERKRG